MKSGERERAQNDLRFRSGFGRVLSASALVWFCAFTAHAQAASQQRIPLKKEPVKKEVQRVDTVWVHDTVTITRVDTVRLGAALFDATPLPPRIDTLTLTRVDTTKNCRDLFLPIPIPIPFGRSHNDPGPSPLNPASPSFSVTPEPSTIVMVGAGLVAVGLFARRKKSKKDPPV